MFWCESIKHGYKFCICEGVWINFTIIHAKVDDHGLLEVFITPEDGNRCLILKMGNKESIPLSSMTEFKFNPRQHVKIEVNGGEITIIGQAYDGIVPRRNLNSFLGNCPFGEEGDWNQSERKVSLKRNENNKSVDNEENERQNLRSNLKEIGWDHVLEELKKGNKEVEKVLSA